MRTQKGKFQGESHPVPSWPNSCLHPPSVGKLHRPRLKSPPPTRGSPAPKTMKPRSRDGAGHTTGSQEAAAVEGKALPFVRVTHPPALPGRRVLHFELPAQGRERPSFRARNWCRAGQAGLAARGGEAHGGAGAATGLLPRRRGAEARGPRLAGHVHRAEGPPPPRSPSPRRERSPPRRR